MLEEYREIINRLVIAFQHFPTSANSPGYMRAQYEPETTSVSDIVGTGTECRLRVINSGPVVWLACPKRTAGAVWFDSQLLCDGKPVAGQDAHLPLRHDVFPAQFYEVSVPLVLLRPGTYMLQVGLTCRGGLSFEQLGTPPVRIPVTIEETDRPRGRGRHRATGPGT